VKGDRGVAAVEMALVLTLFSALLALVAPLTVLFYERVQLGQAAGELARFVTSRSDVPRHAGGVVIPRGLLPTQAALDAELPRFSVDGPATFSRSADADCPSGWRRQVLVSTTVQLGPAGAVFAGLTGSDTTKTLTATASSCEE
jgi:hypothetical protein